MKFFALMTVIALLFSTLAAAPVAAAQEAGNASTATATSSPSAPERVATAATGSTSTTTATATPTPAPSNTNTTDIQISENVKLVKSGYVGSKEEAFVVLKAVDHAEAVTVSDGGALSTGSGTIASEKVALKPGEEVRVQVPVTEVEGRVAVVISTEDALYGKVIEPGNNLFQGTPDWGDVQLSLGTGIFGGIFVVAYMARRELNKDEKQVERVL